MIASRPLTYAHFKLFTAINAANAVVQALIPVPKAVPQLPGEAYFAFTPLQLTESAIWQITVTNAADVASLTRIKSAMAETATTTAQVIAGNVKFPVDSDTMLTNLLRNATILVGQAANITLNSGYQSNPVTAPLVRLREQEVNLRVAALWFNAERNGRGFRFMSLNTTVQIYIATLAELASMPSTGRAGVLAWTTDSNQFYVDNGSGMAGYGGPGSGYAWQAVASDISVFSVASQSAMIALAAKVGDLALRTDNGLTYLLTAYPPSTVGNWVVIAGGGSGGGVSSLNSLTGDLDITAGTGITVTPSGSDIQVALSTPVSVADGGTGTASPGTVAGTGITITGSFPTQIVSLTTPVSLADGGTDADLSATGGTSQVLKQVSAGAAITVGQLSFSDISGTAANAQIPDPTTSALGGIVALSGATSHEWVTYVDTTGVQHLARPAFSDISGTASSGQIPSDVAYYDETQTWSAAQTFSANITINNELIDGTGSAGTSGYILSSTATGVEWIANSGGGGTVTSVALSMPAIFSVSGSPITSSGTFTVSLATESANSIFAGPSSGSAAAPTFRGLVVADLPTSGTWAFAGTMSGSYGMSGTETVSGTLTSSGGTISGTWAGSPTFSGSVTIIPGGTNVGLTITGDAHSSDIADFYTNGSTLAVKIDTSGNLTLNEGLYDSTGSLGSNTYVLSSTGSKTKWVSASGGGAPTTDKYILGSLDVSNLPNSVANPSLYASFDNQPATAGSLDDEFSGSSLNLSRWTWQNQGSATATVQNSVVQMYSPAHSNTNWEWITQPCPSTPWTVQVRLLFLYPSFTNYANAGIVLSDGTKLISFSFSGSTTPATFQVAYFTNQTTYSSTAFGGFNLYMGRWVYMQVQDNGTNLIFSYSVDGAFWIQAFSVSRTAWLSGGPSLVGLGVDAENASNPIYMSCDFFRRTQ